MIIKRITEQVCKIRTHYSAGHVEKNKIGNVGESNISALSNNCCYSENKTVRSAHVTVKYKKNESIGTMLYANLLHRQQSNYVGLHVMCRSCTKI